MAASQTRVASFILQAHFDEGAVAINYGVLCVSMRANRLIRFLRIAQGAIFSLHQPNAQRCPVSRVPIPSPPPLAPICDFVAHPTSKLKSTKIAIFLSNNFVMSKKSSTFEPVIQSTPWGYVFKLINTNLRKT